MGSCICLNVYFYIWGLYKITLPGDPAIAGQSRPNRDPTNASRGATLVIVAVSVSLFAV